MNGAADPQPSFRERFELEAPASRPGQARPSWVGSLVLVPLGLVAAAVGLFLFMSWMVGGGPQRPEELLQEVMAGGYNARKQAFFDLMLRLEEYRAEERLRELPADFDDQVARLFDETTADQALQRYAFGRSLVLLGSDLAYDRLVRMVEDALPNAGEISPSTPLERVGLVETGHLNPLTNGIQLLGQLGDPRAVALLSRLAGSEDGGVRMAAVFALGGIRAPEALPLLRQGLQDPAREVRRNAALALARHGDGSGVAVLVEMLDPAAYQGYGARLGLRDEHIRWALFALRELRASEARPAVEALARSREVSGVVSGDAARWLSDEAAGWPES